MLQAGDAATDEGLSWTADYFAMAPHGMATTHMDALCHVISNGKIYNGYDRSEVRSTGARKNSIMSAKDGIVGRGVLLDVPALKGLDWLEPGSPIYSEDLGAAEERQGVRVEEGDILLIGTGRDARRQAEGEWDFRELGLAGLYADCLPWLHERGIAVIGCDGVSDVLPSGVEGSVQPIHEVIIADMGVHIIDNMALDRLTDTCRELNRYAFALFVAAAAAGARHGLSRQPPGGVLALFSQSTPPPARAHGQGANHAQAVPSPRRHRRAHRRRRHA